LPIEVANAGSEEDAELTTTLCVLLLTIVIAWPALDVLTGWLPKSKDAGEMVMAAGGAVAVPLRLTDCCEPEALS
jgi:hypothetical protein